MLEVCCLPGTCVRGTCVVDRTIAENFSACEANSQKKARRKHYATIAKVKRADGASPRFGPAARQLLAPETVKIIEEANWMDVELHKLATQLNQAAIDREAARKGGLPVRTLPSRHSVCLQGSCLGQMRGFRMLVDTVKCQSHEYMYPDARKVSVCKPTMTASMKPSRHATATRPVN